MIKVSGISTFCLSTAVSIFVVDSTCVLFNKEEVRSFGDVFFVFTAMAASTQTSVDSSDRLSSENCNCIIEKLTTKDFSTYSYKEKMQVIEAGQPKLPLIISNKLKRCTRHFSTKIYDSENWFCGCRYFNKLFCWPCLLFGGERSVWNTTGYDDLNNIYRSAKRHNDSASHIASQKTLHLFGKSQRIEFSLSNQRLGIEKYNEQVRKNREIIGYLIDVTCLLGKLGLTFRDEADSSSCRGNFIELVHELAKYNSTLKLHLDNNSAIFLSLSIQNDIIFAIGKIMREKIKEEISKSNFVAIILDESTDISTKSQMATILRYVTSEGNVEERFLNFTDVSADKTTNGLLNHVLNILNEFDCKENLIALTYDGAAIMAGEHAEFQAKLREHCKNAIFIHWYAHKLNLVLSQSASFIKEVKIFFTNLAGFSSFFTKSNKHTHALDAVVKMRLSSVFQTRWKFRSRLVETVQEHKNDLDSLFQSIAENENTEWDHESVTCARGLFSMLKDFDFNFILLVFSTVFPHSDSLFKILQTKIANINYCNRRIEKFRQYVQDLRNDFDSFWEQTPSFSVDDTQKAKRLRVNVSGQDRKESYRQLFYEILDVIMANVQQRLSETLNLNFLCLLDNKQFDSFSNNFPNDAFSQLCEKYENYFDFTRLKSELSVLYNDVDMKKNSITELHQYVNALQLHDVFPELAKLIQLFLTFPVISTSAEKSSTLKRLKNYLKNTQHQDRLSALALMNIESALLERLRVGTQFKEDVIAVFDEKNQTIQLNYK